MSTTVDLGKVVAECHSGYAFMFPIVNDAPWWNAGSSGTRTCTFTLYPSSKYNVNPLDYAYLEFKFVPYVRITDETGQLNGYCTGSELFVSSINEGTKTYQSIPMSYYVTLTDGTTVKVLDITVTSVRVTYDPDDKTTISVSYSYSCPQSDIVFSVIGSVAILTLYGQTV